MKQSFGSFASLMLVITLFILLFSIQSQAAVTVDNSASYGEFNLVPPVPHVITWSHTIGPGISRALIVTVSRHNDTGTLVNGFQTQKVAFIDSMSNRFDLTSFSLFFPTNTSDNKSSIQIFHLLNPPSGTGTVEVTLDPNSVYAFGSSISLNGVDQSTSFGSYSTNSNSNDSPSITLSDPATGDMVIDGLAAPFSSGSFVVGANQSVCFPPMSVNEPDCRRGRRFFGGISDVGASSTELANSPVTMSWTLTNYVGGDWVMGAVAVKALATTAAFGTISGRVLSNKGRGIPRVSISLTGGNGEVLTARSNPFGYFSFADLEINNAYLIQPRSKSFVFAPQILTLNDSIMKINLYPIAK